MTRDDFVKMREELLKEADHITRTKGKDYTKGNEDILTNFKQGEFLGLSELQVCGIFMKKHTDAVFNYIKTGGQSESEPIRERIKDCINYLLLLNGIIEERKRSKHF